MITPDVLAAEAVQTAKKYELEAEVLTVKEMQERGMGAILAVGAGSVHEPRMIMLKYAKGGDKPFTAFVGKGITFDSGGISIKPSAGMGEMKDDMTGAAAVLGAMEAIAALQLPVNLIGIMACAENMPSGSAVRPGISYGPETARQSKWIIPMRKAGWYWLTLFGTLAGTEQQK